MASLQTLLTKAYFILEKIIVENTAKKRLKLNINNLSLPYMTWSTGQKESMPLLMGFYWVCPQNNERRYDLDTVIIEEPEMGLHPEAIKSVILQIIHLMSRGYKVIVSTHSPVLLEFAWAFNILQAEKAPTTAFEELFDMRGNDKSNFFTNKIIAKKINTYYFNRTDDGVIVKDISTLDAGNEDLVVAEWGGLSSFASKAGEIVSSIVANK